MPHHSPQATIISVCNVAKVSEDNSPTVSNRNCAVFVVLLRLVLPQSFTPSILALVQQLPEAVRTSLSDVDTNVGKRTADRRLAEVRWGEIR